MELSKINGSSCLWHSPMRFLNEALNAVVKKVNGFIENRGGLAQLIGYCMVPSQHQCPKAEESNKIIENAAASGNCKIEKISLACQGSDSSVEGIIFYPKDWDPSDHSRCVVINNPNGAVVSQYFFNGKLCWTPERILELENCPIIFYDYRGTGLSEKNLFDSPKAFRPTYESIVQDGKTVLQYAFKQFQKVTVAGSSLGGGVATVSLDRHLKANPDDAMRVTLFNHDSFSTTPKVVLPKHPVFANWAGWVLGGLLDAENSMKNLAERKIPITILCHLQDPVIRQGARMAEFVETLVDRQNVRVIYSPESEHATLTQDMMHELSSP